MLAFAGALLKFAGSPVERRMLFQPSPASEGDWSPAGLDFEDVYFSAADGTALHGWYCRHRRPRAVLLWCHGNAGNLTHRAAAIRLWQRELPVDVFLFDYRGYGRSAGRATEMGLYSDSLGAYRLLCEQFGVRASQLVLLGRSLGGAVAAQLAVEREHCGLILQSTFTSVADMTREIFRVPLTWMVANRFETERKLASHRGRLLITHGTHDELVPFSMGKRLFETAAGPKTFYPIPHSAHANSDLVGGKEYFRTILRFLEVSLAAGTRPVQQPAPAVTPSDEFPIGGLAFDV